MRTDLPFPHVVVSLIDTLKHGYQRPGAVKRPKRAYQGQYAHSIEDTARTKPSGDAGPSCFLTVRRNPTMSNQRTHAGFRGGELRAKPDRGSRAGLAFALSADPVCPSALILLNFIFSQQLIKPMIDAKRNILTAVRPVYVVGVAVCGMTVFVFWIASGQQEDVIAACHRAWKARRYTEAVSLCDQAFSHTHSPEAATQAARALYKTGDYEEVLRRFENLRQLNEAAALYLAGVIHEQQGKHELARAHLTGALESYRAAGNHADAARAAHWLAGSCRYQAMYGEAIAHLRAALVEAILGHDATMQGYVLLGLADVLIFLGVRAPAEQALKTAKQALEKGAAEERAWLLFKSGFLYEEAGRYALARDAFEKSYRLAVDTKHRQITVGALSHLAFLDRHDGDYLSAADRFARIRSLLGDETNRDETLLYHEGRLELALGKLALAEDTLAKADTVATDPYWTWRIANARGRVAEQRGDTVSAESRYREAIHILEMIRSKLESTEFKSWLLASNREPYEALFSLQARSGQVDEAIATMERAQGRAFIDAFIAATAEPLAAVPSAVEDSIARADALRSFLPRLSRSTIAAPRPVDEIFKAISDAHVLAYFQARNRLWLVRIALGEPQVTELSASPERIERLVERFLANPDDLRVVDELGQNLLPEGSLPTAGTSIYVSPGQLLRRLSFGALRRNHRFVIQDHAISYVPSVTALAAILALPPEPCGEAVVMGNPHGDLPGAEREAELVATLLGVEPITGNNATIERFRSGANASVLHVATHTGICPTGVWLDLSDSRLGVPDILDWQIRPRLAVVASCASGISQAEDTWGSLAAAFLASGTPTVFATLWSIDDQQATDMMLRFYRAGALRNPAEALALAQRSISEEKPISAWAPFVLIGVGRSVCAN